jgi:hypothetical protein
VHGLRCLGAKIVSLGALHRREVHGDLAVYSGALAKQNSGILSKNRKKE